MPHGPSCRGILTSLSSAPVLRAPCAVGLRCCRVPIRRTQPRSAAQSAARSRAPLQSSRTQSRFVSCCRTPSSSAPVVPQAPRASPRSSPSLNATPRFQVRSCRGACPGSSPLFSPMVVVEAPLECLSVLIEFIWSVHLRSSVRL